MEQQTESLHRVDESLVDVRDAFAHGRAVGLDPKGPYRLIKFSRAEEGVVGVETAVELSPSWLREQARRTMEQVLGMREAARSLGLACFPEE